MVGRVLGSQSGQRMDMEATENALREMGHRLGGSLLEKLLNGRGSRISKQVECGKGHQAGMVEMRTKGVTTVLGKVEIERAYYYCKECEDGVIPKDRELDIVGTSLSPGVRRMIGRVGGKEPFDEGRADLEELAGVIVSTKAVERAAEAIGADIEERAKPIREAAVTGKVVTLESKRTSIDRMYIAMDGTGVPVLPSETVGRKGKSEFGDAKTREARLGCVFTQTKADDSGNPMRDEDSTSYVGAIENAEQFGPRIYAEAVRRGVREAKEVVVLGDGAPWIWTIADLHFHGATQVLDVYHALEHMTLIGKSVYPVMDKRAKKWLDHRIEQVKRGDIAAVVRSLKRLHPEGQEASSLLSREIEYFQKNRERMRYDEFRKRGLFTGSGVVEAGCKTVMGRRLKQSGMRWTVRGANAIIALRCCQMSGLWETYWEARSAG
jgi:hypothetical protein